MKYLVIFLVLVGFVGIAFGQYLGDKFPPGTVLPDYEGDYIFPPDYVDFYYSDSHFEKYSVTDQQYRYDIPYMISNGTIFNMSINCSDVELVLNVEPSGNKGWITLALPRVLVDSKMGISQDDNFFVLLDSKEVSHSDIPAEKLRMLIIPFYHDTAQVNVIGVNYPEHAGENACNGKHEPPFSYVLSPLKQSTNNIAFDEIQCKQDLVLIQKYDGSPACVTESTKTKLIERGWTGQKTWEPSPTDGFTPTDMPYFENQNANELKSYRNIKNSIVMPDNALILSSKELDRTLDDLRQVGLPIVMSAIDYDTGVIAIWTPDVTQEKLFKEHLGDIPFVLLYEEAPPRWETGDPKPEPEPKNEN